MLFWEKVPMSERVRSPSLETPSFSSLPTVVLVSRNKRPNGKPPGQKCRVNYQWLDSVEGRSPAADVCPRWCEFQAVQVAWMTALPDDFHQQPVAVQVRNNSPSNRTLPKIVAALPTEKWGDSLCFRHGYSMGDQRLARSVSYSNSLDLPRIALHGESRLRAI